MRIYLCRTRPDYPLGPSFLLLGLTGILYFLGLWSHVFNIITNKSLFSFILGTNHISPHKSQLPFASVTFNKPSLGMLSYYLFGLVWNHAFLGALPTFVIASACCLWYFTHQHRRHPSPISTSLCRGIFFHLGSIALGSFLIALVDFVRIILSYFEVLRDR